MDEDAALWEVLELRGPPDLWGPVARVAALGPGLAAETSGWTGSIHHWAPGTPPPAHAPTATANVNSSKNALVDAAVCLERR